MKRPQFPVSSMTRRVRLKVRGSERTKTSDDTKSGAVKKLPDKGKDRVQCKRK